ncbi:carboxypeptidase-like regulatory domain-containing protein [Spirosoma endophyticum]|uniref:carboxypeptidase-like regulatory domain-containing protein n=1 Tax=Spirosoma endophyticum TaxID=662367 RepID=UPI0021CE084C|nr:carboxypeptidase-like regulatory domain-containing protein [Spirosoma endophyticum]
MEGSSTKLADVLISINGTSFGTYSDANGQYRVKLSPGEQQLVVSAIGYLPREVHVDDQQVINISLQLDPLTLPELKVTGYIVPQYSRRMKKALRKRQRQPTTHFEVDSLLLNK